MTWVRLIKAARIVCTRGIYHTGRTRKLKPTCNNTAENRACSDSFYLLYARMTLSSVIQTSPTDCSDDSWKDTFLGKQEHGALCLLIRDALEKHLLTYLLTYLLMKRVGLWPIWNFFRFDEGMGQWLPLDTAVRKPKFSATDLLLKSANTHNFAHRDDGKNIECFGLFFGGGTYRALKLSSLNYAATLIHRIEVDILSLRR